MLGLGLLWYLISTAAPRFSGEDPLAPSPNEDNWHHEGLSRKAARRAGWSSQAETALAFHADYLDSYLYSPLWWFHPDGGGVPRLRVALSSEAELVKVHFDDLFAPETVRAMWRQYLSGTVCGLLWIANQDLPADAKASMAHNVVGASLHALQDFWTHSNWIDDPARRSTTWFDMSPSQRSTLPLWTGSYELADHLGIKPHGAYVFECSVLKQFPQPLLDLICHAASPLVGSLFCDAVSRCKDTNPIDPPSVAGINPPNGILYIKEGINVDNSWLSPVGARQRGIESQLPMDRAFASAYQLAYRTSCQWLHILEHTMEDAGLTSFWNEVKTLGKSNADFLKDRDPWERFDQLPYRFISSGPYPPTPFSPDTTKWYLRLTVATADVEFAGTNADLIPTIDGVKVEALDHGPKPGNTVLDAALGFDDHERGTRPAYYLGPFLVPPTYVTIRNNAPSAGQVLEAAGRAILNAIVTLFNGIVGFFKSLFGTEADFVAKDHFVFQAAQLEALTPGQWIPFTLNCFGVSEGNYQITGRCEATNDVTGGPVPSRRYVIRVQNLFCVEESDWDRFTFSDEPFVVGVVIPHGGGSPPLRWKTEPPFSDIDTGDTVAINQSFEVWIPRRYGFISIAAAIYESDDESPVDRDLAMHAFADGAAANVAPTETEFAVVLSEAIAAGWRPQRIEAAAFRRGEEAEVRFYAPFDPNRWVEGGQDLSWTLVEVSRQTVAVPDTINCKCAPDCGQVEVPGEIETIDIPLVNVPIQVSPKRSRA